MRTHLIFDGNAEEAMRFYASVFEDVRIEQLERFGPFEQGIRGSVRHASLRVGEAVLSCSDALPGRDCEFSEAVSIAVSCRDEAELERLAAALLREGQPLGGARRDRAGRRSAWVRDRFGVAWWLSATSVPEALAG